MNAIINNWEAIDSLRASEGGSLLVIEADFRRDRRWLDFVSSHPDALVYHHSGWLGALEDEYDRPCIAFACVDSDGVFQGVLPLLPTKGLPISFNKHPVGRRLSSLPRTPLAGPLALNARAAEALVRAAMTRVCDEPGMQLELKTMIADLDQLIPELACIRWRDTYVRDFCSEGKNLQVAEGADVSNGGSSEMHKDCCTLRFGNAHNNHRVKWAVSKAIKHGLHVRLAETERDLSAWYQLYLDGMRRNAVPARPYRFFVSLWNSLGRSGVMKLILVEQATGHGVRLVSGSVLLSFDSGAFWAFTGTRENDLPLHANDLTIWHCLQESYGEGYRWFDLGEVAEDHPELAQFKAKWGTVKKPIFRYYYPMDPNDLSTAQRRGASNLSSRVTRAAWQMLPLKSTALLSDCIYRYL